MQDFQSFALVAETLAFPLEPRPSQLPQMDGLLPQPLADRYPVGQQGHHGGRGCGRPQVGHQVGDGGVIFMANATHHRHRAVGQAEGQFLVVKNGQILPAAAAAGKHHGFDAHGFGLTADPYQGLCDLPVDGPLHWNRNHQQPGGGPALGGRAQHVGQCRAGAARQQGDALREGGQGPFAGRIQEPFAGQLVAHLLKLAQHAAEAGPDLQGLDAEAGPTAPKIQLAHHHHAVPIGRHETEPGQLGGPHHRRDRGLTIDQGHPEMALLELGSADGGIQQKAGRKAALQQAGHGPV